MGYFITYESDAHKKCSLEYTIKALLTLSFMNKGPSGVHKTLVQAIPIRRIPYPESIDENRHNLQNKSELRVTSLESHRFLILFQCTTKMYYECCIWNSIINRKEKWIQGTVVYFSEIGKEFWRRLQTWVFENSTLTSSILDGLKLSKYHILTAIALFSTI